MGCLLNGHLSFGVLSCTMGCYSTSPVAAGRNVVCYKKKSPVFNGCTPCDVCTNIEKVSDNDFQHV